MSGEKGVTKKAHSVTPIAHFVNVSLELVKQTHKLIIDTLIFALSSPSVGGLVGAGQDM